MKAGTALGLLAGLGAMNAMSGKPYGGKRFTGLMDMLDGGGAGASGDKFEGGGLLSALGNLFMKPLQAQQNVERIASNTAANNAVREVLKDAAKKQFDSQTVQDLAAANEDAYLQEAYGTPQVAPDIYNIGSAGEFGGTMPTVNLAKPDISSEGTALPVPAASQQSNISAGGLLAAPEMPVREGLLLPRDAEGILVPEIPASESNTKVVSFNRRMETVPEMLRGTESEAMYRDYLLGGGLATFAQFFNQSMATEDPEVKRSPVLPEMVAPSVPSATAPQGTMSLEEAKMILAGIVGPKLSILEYSSTDDELIEMALDMKRRNVRPKY